MAPCQCRMRYLAAALTALTIGACRGSTDSSSPFADSKLTGDIGATARDEVEAAVNALTLPSTLNPVGTAQAAAGTTAFSSPPCVTPSTITDSDGDGVPDEAVYIFTAPPCSFSGWRGGTFDIVGQLQIRDPAPSGAGFGYEATLTKLRTRFTSADKKVITDVERNGTRVLSGSISSLVLSADLQIGRNFAGKPDAFVDQQWSLTFAPATSLQINAPIPSGQLDIAGTFNWSRGTEENFVLTVTTPTPLHYNADCTDTVQRIDSGELNALGTIEAMNGFVRVRWSGCGKEPSYSFVPAE
jgi:hypothetical protein